jgi:FkbM family methyltransferase
MHATQNKKLIYDIGFHKGEDLGYYLHLGYKVVGVDADPKMVENLKQIYSNEFNSGQLIILNHAISDKDNEEVEFNISEWSFWNSLRKEVASRDNKQVNSIYVITKRLDSIMHQFGIPYYCKIDIEGLDALAVNTLNNLEHKPTFISVETECLGADELIMRKL